MYYPKNKYRSSEKSRIQTKRRNEKERFPSSETRARMSRGRGKETSTCRRVSAAVEGKWLVVESRSIQPKVQNAASRAKIRTDGNINRSSFSSSSSSLSLSLSLFRFFFTPRSFIRGCNLDLGFIARDRTCCFLFLLFLFLFLASFFLSFFVSFL